MGLSDAFFVDGGFGLGERGPERGVPSPRIRSESACCHHGLWVLASAAWPRGATARFLPHAVLAPFRPLPPEQAWSPAPVQAEGGISWGRRVSSSTSLFLYVGTYAYMFCAVVPASTSRSIWRPGIQFCLLGCLLRSLVFLKIFLSFVLGSS